MLYKIYHNPRCRKSRAGLQYLKDKGFRVEVIEYMKKPLSEKELSDILVRLNKRPHEILRTQEDIFRNRFKGKNFTDVEWIKIMVEHPQLIQRPIIVKNYKAVIGDPPSNIDNLLI
jgi:arsenate reductase